MSKPAGRNLPLSPFRRLVVDLMHFSSKVPSVTIDRRMNLRELVLARQACNPRPGWCAIFLKALGRVAVRYPDLRRSYMPYPWPHLYEHPRNIACLNVQRTYGNEPVVVQAAVRSPENRSLPELDALIRSYKDRPLPEISCFIRAMRLGRLPMPVRRLVWWIALNWLGRRRAHNFGTIGITSVASSGVGVHKIIPILTSTLHYGLFDEQGRLEMRFTFDHRVLDGVTAANALVDFESVLQHEILDELRSLRALPAAA